MMATCMAYSVLLIASFLLFYIMLGVYELAMLIAIALASTIAVLCGSDENANQRANRYNSDNDSYWEHN